MQLHKQTIQELIKENRIKTMWSELECHGAVEFANLLFQEQAGYGNIAQSIIVEDRVVCMNLFEGIPFQSPEGLQMITRMYIDLNDNVIFATRQGSLYIYETEGMDATDLRHYFGQD